METSCAAPAEPDRPPLLPDLRIESNSPADWFVTRVVVLTRCEADYLDDVPELRGRLRLALPTREIGDVATPEPSA